MRKPKTLSRHLAKPLTAVELEMMNVIWRIGPCSVTQIQQELASGRELAYTSISTMVRILEQKGYVVSEKVGRGHLYSAAVSKESYQASSLRHLLDDVFEGTPALLVRRLLDSESLTAEELAEIGTLLRGKGH
jgi:predicted transcriptional regulator